MLVSTEDNGRMDAIDEQRGTVPQSSIVQDNELFERRPEASLSTFYGRCASLDRDRRFSTSQTTIVAGRVCNRPKAVGTGVFKFDAHVSGSCTPPTNITRTKLLGAYKTVNIYNPSASGKE